MRWKKYYPKDKEERIIKKFLFMPLEIKSEVRWLEFAKIKQEFVVTRAPFSWSYWRDIEFVNN